MPLNNGMKDDLILVLFLCVIFLGWQNHKQGNDIEDNFNLIDAVEADSINARNALDSDRQSLRDDFEEFKEGSLDAFDIIGDYL